MDFDLATLKAGMTEWRNRELKLQRFWATDGNRKCAVFVFNSSSHYHIYIFKYLFTSRDDYFENLRETTVLACEMFTSGCRPWLKNVACLSSLLLTSTPVMLNIHHLYGLFIDASNDHLPVGLIAQLVESTALAQQRSGFESQFRTAFPLPLKQGYETARNVHNRWNRNLNASQKILFLVFNQILAYGITVYIFICHSCIWQ